MVIISRVPLQPPENKMYVYMYIELSYNTLPPPDTAVSISDILVHLLQLLYSLPPPPAPSTSDPWDHTHSVTSLDPALLILRLFRQLLSGSAGSRDLLTQVRNTIPPPRMYTQPLCVAVGFKVHVHPYKCLYSDVSSVLSCLYCVRVQGSFHVTENHEQALHSLLPRRPSSPASSPPLNRS